MVTLQTKEVILHLFIYFTHTECYNINEKSSAPQMESVCDICGGKLYQRNDDNIEAFKTRYEMYQEKTAPIIEHYRKMGVLKEVNGDDTVENVFKDISASGRSLTG